MKRNLKCALYVVAAVAVTLFMWVNRLHFTPEGVWNEVVHSSDGWHPIEMETMIEGDGWRDMLGHYDGGVALIRARKSMGFFWSEGGQRVIQNDGEALSLKNYRTTSMHDGPRLMLFQVNDPRIARIEFRDLSNGREIPVEGRTEWWADVALFYWDRETSGTPDRWIAYDKDGNVIYDSY